MARKSRLADATQHLLIWSAEEVVASYPLIISGLTCTEPVCKTANHRSSGARQLYDTLKAGIGAATGYQRVLYLVGEGLLRLTATSDLREAQWRLDAWADMLRTGLPTSTMNESVLQLIEGSYDPVGPFDARDNVLWQDSTPTRWEEAMARSMPSQEGSDAVVPTSGNNQIRQPLIDELVEEVMGRVRLLNNEQVQALITDLQTIRNSVGSSPLPQPSQDFVDYPDPEDTTLGMVRTGRISKFAQSRT